MKILLDQGTPRSAAALLRQAGFDTVHTSEIGMAESADREILQRAFVEGRVVVTLDADFHALLALSQARQPSVIRIRMEGLRAEAFSELLQSVVQRCSADLGSGAMVSVRDFQIRMRLLPVA
jgi:predicted nuclease of predicted toxin-antitoxin system